MYKIKKLIKQAVRNEGIAKGVLGGNRSRMWNIKESENNDDTLIWLIQNCKRDTLNKIRDTILKNIWSDFCMGVILKHKDYFKEYFLSKEIGIKNILIGNIYNIFIEVSSNEEHKYLEFTDLDVEVLERGKKIITRNWSSRNLYILIKELLPEVAKEILSEAIVVYGKYLMDLEEIYNCEYNLLEQFTRLRTHEGRIKFLEQKIWLKASLTKINGQEKININSLVYLSREIIRLLNYSLRIKDFIAAVDILDIVLFTIGNFEGEERLSDEVDVMKEKVVNEIRLFLYNKQIKQVYNILVNI